MIQVAILGFGTVGSGVLEVLVDGAWRSLDQGEAVRFAADRPHGYRNLGVAPAIFHNLIHYPAMATR